jgi:hypothetical protein
MGFSGNFTGVTLGDDPAAPGTKALFVEGRTDATDLPKAISIILPLDGRPLTATVEKPTLIDWEVKFSHADAPLQVGDEVFVVGVATRKSPHDPFVWEGSFKLESRDPP